MFITQTRILRFKASMDRRLEDSTEAENGLQSSYLKELNFPEVLFGVSQY